MFLSVAAPLFVLFNIELGGAGGWATCRCTFFWPARLAGQADRLVSLGQLGQPEVIPDFLGSSMQKFISKLSVGRSTGDIPPGLAAPGGPFNG